MKRLTKEQFIEKAIEIHGNKYDYSKVDYINNSTNVCIICPTHGEFWQKPISHLNGNGCKMCGIIKKSNKRKLTTEQFIERARKIHGDKYDYTKTTVRSRKEKVCIICPIHGEFWQTPVTHLKGCGCTLCSLKKKSEKQCSTTQEFIEKAKQVHGDKYDYSKVNYVNAKTKVCIICPIHGEFWQTPIGHLNNREGCIKCSKSVPHTNCSWIEKAKQVHGDKYDYSKVEYVNANTKVLIKCNNCGNEFYQRASSHLSGYGCKHCASLKLREKYSLTKEQFIEKAIEIHGSKYDYSKVEYINVDTKVCIICPIHGEFWQTPIGHLNNREGCPNCKKSKLEDEITMFLTENNINFETEKTFDWLINDKTKSNMFLDFYIPSKNIAIECQGGQHFVPVKKFGGIESLDKIVKRDKEKFLLCKNNGIIIYYFFNKKYLKLASDNIYLNNNSHISTQTLREIL